MKLFDVILADPPWDYYGQQDKWGAAAKFYPLMSDSELLGMEIPLKPRGVLFLWATCPRLDFAIELGTRWAGNYRGVAFVWCKTTQTGNLIGAQGVRPSIIKPTTELVLAFSPVKTGRPMKLYDESIVQTVLAPRQEHSRKPDAVMERIERMYPYASKLEMFARRPRHGWEAMGNEYATI